MAVQSAPRTDGDLAAPDATQPMPATQLPAPVGVPVRTEHAERHRQTLRERLAGGDHAARKPYPIAGHVRVVLGLLLSALCLLTAAGALLLLMAWRQESTDGLLVSQTDRMWDVWDTLATVERYTAAAAGAIALVWVGVSALNVHRATGKRRSAALAVIMFGAGLAGVWVAGAELVAPGLADDDWIGVAGGLALQAVAIALPLLVLERLADAAAARHRPGRVAAVMAIGFVAVIQLSGGLATIDRTTDLHGWGRSGALVLIAALIQVLGALAFTEAGRALEEGTQHRYELRSRFGESVLLQVTN